MNAYSRELSVQVINDDFLFGAIDDGFFMHVIAAVVSLLQTHPQGIAQIPPGSTSFQFIHIPNRIPLSTYSIMPGITKIIHIRPFWIPYIPTFCPSPPLLASFHKLAAVASDKPKAHL
jgi:hypothetical protein